VAPLGKLAASPPQRGFGQSFFFLLFDLHVDEAQHAGSASLAGIEGLLRFRLIEGLADRLREEHDEAAEPKPTLRSLSPERAENGRISLLLFTDFLVLAQARASENGGDRCSVLNRNLLSVTYYQDVDGSLTRLAT
jgi:hypothetical protein